MRGKRTHCMWLMWCTPRTDCRCPLHLYLSRLIYSWFTSFGSCSQVGNAWFTCSWKQFSQVGPEQLRPCTICHYVTTAGWYMDDLEIGICPVCENLEWKTPSTPNPVCVIEYYCCTSCKCCCIIFMTSSIICGRRSIFQWPTKHILSPCIRTTGRSAFAWKTSWLEQQ